MTRLTPRRTSWSLGTVLLLWLAVAADLHGNQPVADGWRVYENCKLIENPANDGDSFHVRAGNRRHYLFRIYFVDAPETDNWPQDRVQEQADYYDGISINEVLKTGKEATEFALEFLKEPFIVYSRLEDARGRSQMPRYFAMVKNQDGQYLSEALVANGLGRIFGMFTPVLPCGRDGNKYIADLRVAERQAKREGLGGWAYSQQTSTRSLADVQIEEQRLVTRQAVSVYSLDRPPRYLGTMPSGTEILVLGAETPFMLRIQVEVDGETHVLQCQRSLLGL